jgi:hypothetical protein
MLAEHVRSVREQCPGSRLWIKLRHTRQANRRRSLSTVSQMTSGVSGRASTQLLDACRRSCAMLVDASYFTAARTKPSLDGQRFASKNIVGYGTELQLTSRTQVHTVKWNQKVLFVDVRGAPSGLVRCVSSEIVRVPEWERIVECRSLHSPIPIGDFWNTPRMFHQWAAYSAGVVNYEIRKEPIPIGVFGRRRYDLDGGVLPN